MPKFFRFPWASTGDKTTIPDETDVAGFVSYQQGYGNDYARDPASDPLAKLIERDKMNQLFSDLTENVQYWQTHAFPEYITAAQNGGVAYAYDIDAIVRYDDGGGYKVYQNQTAGNTNLPTGAGWVEYNIASLINAATSKTTPADADVFGIVDSAASFVLKKLTWANIKTALTGLFAPINSPAFTGTPTINGSNAVSNATLRTELNATGTAPIYACRAWVNFNGTGTVAIRASGNVSSITDRGVGLYSVNLTTALPDINGSAHTGTALDTNTSAANGVTTGPVRIVSTTVINIGTGNTGGPADQTDIYCSVFR